MPELLLYIRIRIHENVSMKSIKRRGLDIILKSSQMYWISCVRHNVGKNISFEIGIRLMISPAKCFFRAAPAYDTQSTVKDHLGWVSQLALIMRLGVENDLVRNRQPVWKTQLETRFIRRIARDCKSFILTSGCDKRLSGWSSGNV